MSIRRKILFYFSFTVIAVTAGAFLFVYMQFSEYREEQFQQRQKEKIASTLKLLSEVKDWDEQIFLALDNSTIHDFYDEKLMIFDSNKTLIYKSVDDLSIGTLNEILAVLSVENEWTETKEGIYDVVGVAISSERHLFYGISKAYDIYGYEKLTYLRNTLLITFISISLIVYLIALYLSKIIARPISEITRIIDGYDFKKDNTPIETDQNTREIRILAQRFNEMMLRMNKAFAFQKHVVHHISHELKTPVAVLVSNFEAIEQETNMRAIKEMIARQKEDTKSLGEIINALLEISKAESGEGSSSKEPLRVDELIFDIADELTVLHANSMFSITYTQVTEDESMLTIMADKRLLKLALTNLMLNAIQYSSDKQASVVFDPQPETLYIQISNNGEVIQEEERQFLFQHFFRGANSKGRRGFGLGLVLIHKILHHHGGDISYFASTDHSNTFLINLPVMR